MKLRKSARVIILGTLHILILLPKAICSGVFELRLSSFKNDRGLDYDGNCCNGVKDTTNPSLGPVCTEQCRTFFTICVTNYRHQIPMDITKEKCMIGYVTTSVLGDNNLSFDSFNGSMYPVDIHFEISWPGTFSLIIETWHDATLDGPKTAIQNIVDREKRHMSGEDSIVLCQPLPKQAMVFDALIEIVWVGIGTTKGNTGSPRERISRLAVQRELSVGSSWSNFIHKTDQTELEYKYRVLCSENYYGPDCLDFCKPRNDSFGHYSCNEAGEKICLPGWRGEYCDQAICRDGCHPDHGTCNRPNECQCKTGWTGTNCTECIKYPGCQHGTCERPWQCNCEEGWGGLFCNQDLNYCTHYAPCLNGGLCTNAGSGSYTCKCPDGFTGTNCEREIDYCLNQPCLNGGVCEDAGAGYSCRCPIGYTGRQCDVRAESCEKNPCKNGATCVEGQGSYFCICETGFTGENCEQEIYECDPNPCQNNGQCIDKVNAFQCVCETGFTGPYCEVNIDDCVHNPCTNNGSCIDKVNAFKCLCVAGFVGELCEINVDDCELRPCANGGACQDRINDFKCTCRPGFTGKFCTIDIDECASNPCRNGANCTQSLDDYHCACPFGFSGKNCQFYPGQTTETSLSTPERTTEKVRPTKAYNMPEEEDDLTMTQLLLIVCLGVGIPLLLIIIAVTILLCRKRRLPNNSKEEAENVQNSINNKLRESKIFTTIPQSSSTFSNLTSKISNEDMDFNTLKSNRSSRPISQIYIGEKTINNKQLLYNKDLHVHSKHRDFEKTTKKLEKDKISIDPSNLDVREYCSSQDIHPIEKHINRDSLNRNSLLYLEPQIHPDSHRHSSHGSYYGEDVLATEV